MISKNQRQFLTRLALLLGGLTHCGTPKNVVEDALDLDSLEAPDSPPKDRLETFDSRDVGSDPGWDVSTDLSEVADLSIDEGGAWDVPDTASTSDRGAEIATDDLGAWEEARDVLEALDVTEDASTSPADIHPPHDAEEDHLGLEAGAPDGARGDVLDASDDRLAPADVGVDASDQPPVDVQDPGADAPCVAGMTVSCFSGSRAMRRRGICRDGTRSCLGGVYGPCEGEVLPRPEVCNNLDDNCDGATDNATSATDPRLTPCTVTLGVCSVTANRVCRNGEPTCTATVSITSETCNNQDDDCDGVIDNGVTRMCYSGPIGSAGHGICRYGLQRCQAGVWSPCEGEVTPGVEVCNGLDDDCNDLADAPLDRPCYSGPPGTAGRGVCRGGFQTCGMGSWLARCYTEIVPTPEVCNGRDDDCNGTVDDLPADGGIPCRDR